MTLADGGGFGFGRMVTLAGGGGFGFGSCLVEWQDCSTDVNSCMSLIFLGVIANKKNH